MVFDICSPNGKKGKVKTHPFQTASSAWPYMDNPYQPFHRCGDANPSFAMSRSLNLQPRNAQLQHISILSTQLHHVKNFRIPFNNSFIKERKYKRGIRNPHSFQVLDSMCLRCSLIVCAAISWMSLYPSCFAVSSSFSNSSIGNGIKLHGVTQNLWNVSACYCRFVALFGLSVFNRSWSLFVRSDPWLFAHCCCHHLMKVENGEILRVSEGKITHVICG